MNTLGIRHAVANLADLSACNVIYRANFVTEPSVSPSAVPEVNIEAESVDTEAAKKEQEYVHKIALNLKLNIQILLSSLVETLLSCHSNS